MDHVTIKKSAHLASAGYDGGRLQIKFHNGQTHEFTGVPERLYNVMMGSTSKGQFFHKFIKPYYRGTEI